MTVSDLIGLLSGYDAMAEVVMQKDAEGNSYSPLSGVDDAHYVAHTTWSGDCFDLESEAIEHGTPQKCVVLWPVN